MRGERERDKRTKRRGDDVKYSIIIPKKKKKKKENKLTAHHSAPLISEQYYYINIIIIRITMMDGVAVGYQWGPPMVL